MFSGKGLSLFRPPEGTPHVPEGVYALANILMYPLPLLPVFPYVTFPKSFTHNGLEYLLYGRNIGGYVYFGGGGWGGGLKILQ